jgi:predicted phage baseplate assembly protein
MALDAIQLDTLTWDQMVTAIRTRIAANSKSAWTLHAPVDPGVTLLELFAWLLEQRIYWMDQIPDALVQGILQLLGEAPLAAMAAVTVLQLAGGSKSATFPIATAGIVMRRGNVNPPLLFTLAEDITVLPMGGTADTQVSVIVNGADRTPDLKRGRVVALLTPSRSSASVEFALTLNAALPALAPGSPISLLIELENPADIPAQWLASPDTNIAPPATLSWSYRSSAQTQPVPFPAAQVVDGTAGLRRTGIVRLPIPGDWQPEPSPISGAKPVYKILLDISNAAYAAPPRLLRVSPNVALARHTWARVKQVPTKLTSGQSVWPPLPGNVIRLASIPGDSTLKEFPPREDTVKVQIQERDGQQHAWTLVPSLSFSGPADRVFTVNREGGEVRFGDGLTGRLPVVAGKAASEIEVTYEAGGGVADNVGANLDWESVAIGKNIPPSLTAINLVRGEGGRESETLAAAKQRVMAAFGERNRAVTAQDYENLVQTTPGAGFVRAHAEAGFDPEFPCTTVPGVVSVFVVPYAPRENDGTIDPDQFVEAPQPDLPALCAARMRLNLGRMIGTQVYVLPPAYRQVWVEVDAATDKALSSDLREKVALRLRTFLDPLAGGDDGTGWPFGFPLRPSALLREAQNVLGDSGEVLRVAVRISGSGTAESCVDVRIGSHELPKLEQVQVRVQARPVTAGGLR